MLKKKILFIHHSPSINTRQLSDCVVKKINKLNLKISLKTVTPLDVNFQTFNYVNGVIIGTTENFGYMAGLTKDFFDRNYDLLRETTQGLPIFYYVRAGLDGEGSKVAINKILKGLGWKQVLPPIVLKGPWQKSFLDDLESQASNFAHGIELGIY